MSLITIGGNPGAGKTTLAIKLATMLHYEELYVGQIFRDMAAERNMSIEEFYAALKSDPALERSVDDRQAKLMQEKDNLIVQGRIAWHFTKQSPFKIINILLTVDPTIGAARIAERKENAGKSIQEIARATQERSATERDRYQKLYNIQNYLDPAHYDIILNTSRIDANETLRTITERIASLD